MLLLFAASFSSADISITSSNCTSDRKCKCSVPSPNRLLADCSNLNLMDSPSFLGKVTDIDISFNQLLNVSINHASPSKLLHLNFAHNNISIISTENNQRPFFRFSELQSLNLSSNGIKLTETNFPDHMFTDLSKLEILDISNNTKLFHHEYNSTQTLDKVWLPLVSLRTLMVDGIQNVTFGGSISTLTNLTHLVLAGRCSKARLRVIDKNYFLNFPYIETLDLSSKYVNDNHLPFYDRSFCSLEAIHGGAIAKLTALKYLDISYNRYLGLCGFRNATYDLPNTKITVFNASYLQCESSMSLTLYCDDVSPLINTTIEELYFDGNSVSFGQTGLLRYFPESLKRISIKGNRWVRGRYGYLRIEDVTGLQFVDISDMNEHQMSRSNLYYETCDNFVADMNCENYRSTHTKMSMKEYEVGYCVSEIPPVANRSKQVCEKTFTPHSISPGCSIDLITIQCEVHVVAIPPNLTHIRMERARLGRTLDWILFVWENVLESLDLSNNEFYSIVGPICNATHLKHLDLSNNGIFHLSTYVFGFLFNIESLLLGNNRIGESDLLHQANVTHLFSNQTELKFLNLEDNKITFLPKNIFYNMKSLQTLKLNNNKLMDWNFTIASMSNLENVNLSYNQIVYLSKNGMTHIDGTSSKRLRIDLSNNPFECSCRSLDFIDWLVKSKNRFTDISNYLCSMDDEVYNIESAHMVLTRSCASYTTVTVTVSSFLALFISIVIGVIMHRYRFQIRYWYYIAKRDFWQHGYQKLYDKEQYRFDAFVSYADEDRMFVRNKLIQQLETNEGLSLCIHHRDFIPGCSIDENIINGIHYSRKVIFVITHSFLQSRWCLYEINAAHTEFMSNVSRGSQDFMSIFVFKEDVFNCLPKVIANKVNTDTYIEFPENEEDDASFWIKLKDSLCER